MKRILFVHNYLSTFVQIDRDLLAENHTVTELYLAGITHVNPFKIYQAVSIHDIVFCWFASWHSLLPVLFAKYLDKPSIVVIGGYDTANIPEADYGSQRGGLRRLISRTVIQNAVHLVTNSQAAKKEAIFNAVAEPKKITVIYHGLAPPNITSENGREQLVLTVGGVWKENLLRKGLLPFVQAAAFIPSVKFVHVGRWHDKSIEQLRKIASKNVEFRGFLSDQELAKLYTRASVYVQPSKHEGFGLSVAEAMLAGCIPVTTRNGSLPEVVGDTGVFLSSTEPSEIASSIQEALNWESDKRQSARKRILTLFSLHNRRQGLFNLIEKIN